MYKMIILDKMYPFINPEKDLSGLQCWCNEQELVIYYNFLIKPNKSKYPARNCVTEAT